LKVENLSPRLPENKPECHRVRQIKALLGPLAILLLLTFPIQQGAADSSKLKPQGSGDDTYTFTLSDLRGQSKTLSDYNGKVVLVNFWASWCPPCIKEMPAMVRLKQQLNERPFEILALNVGEKKYRVWKFVKLIEFDLPVLLDESSDTSRNWGVETLPTSFLLDADGRVRYRVRGDPDWDDPDTIAVIEQLLAENAPAID
jgi:thiol-disulfide isomerase/thioredoxin